MSEQLTPEQVETLRGEYHDLNSASIAYVVRKSELEVLEAQIKSRKAQLELEMDVIKDDILYDMEQKNLPKVTTSVGSISRSTKDTPFVKPDEWDAVHAYIRETGRFDLLQKRLTATVATAILMGDADLGIEPQVIPGVGLQRVSAIRITRIKPKS